ncbi:DNA repair protein RadC [Agaribacterium sp. ZY112]|uniref:RadC family protein n=1 Tax=Agaribacterium sp. ZY112 TaxID=3233574 RepID=UPI0035236AE6
MAISDWPASERPREKLISQGATALSDAELLAIFLRTGCAGLSAVELARSLLLRFGSLRALLESSRNDFCSAKGLGLAKYSQLQAVLEMSRRHLAEHLQRDDCLNSSEAVKRFLSAKLRHQCSEVFAVLFLDSQHRLIEYEELFNGTIDGAGVYPREVVKAALAHNCAAVIFAHNHPSGIAEPSQSDQRITERLRQALALVDINTLDHIIVGEGSCLSFAERGLL